MNIHQLLEVIGASVVSIGGFIVIYACLYDLCHMLDKSKTKRIKRKELRQRRERLFKNNKVI